MKRKRKVGCTHLKIQKTEKSSAAAQFADETSQAH